MSAGTETPDDIRTEVARLKRILGLDINRLALDEGFESTTYSPIGVNVIEFVNVTTSIVAGIQTGT